MSLGNTSIHQQGDIPEIIKLPNDRIRVIRRFQKFTREDVDNVNLGSLMGNFGDLGSLMGNFGVEDNLNEQIPEQGYDNCRLISVEVDTRFNATSNTDNAVLTKTYETLTSSFVEITDPTVEVEENGLRKITKVYRAVSGTTSSNTVGTTALPTTGEILADSQLEDNTAFAELTETYLENGILSETIDAAPREFPSSVRITRTSRGIESVPDGVLVDSRDQDVAGYKTFTRTTIKSLGTDPEDLTGVVSEYTDIVEVETIGRVDIEKVNVNQGDIAIPKHTPPRIKQVSANVVVEVTTTLPNTDPSEIAYNLEDASCAITSVRSTDRYQSGNTVSSKSGIFTFSATGFNRSISNSARIQSYDGSYFVSNEEDGSVDFQSSSSPYLDEDGTIQYSTGDSTEITKCIGSGATGIPTSYKEYGLVKRTANLILTALDGTSYYQVTSYTIPNPTP
jgi:hypothetical protein